MHKGDKKSLFILRIVFSFRFRYTEGAERKGDSVVQCEDRDFCKRGLKQEVNRFDDRRDRCTEGAVPPNGIE